MFNLPLILLFLSLPLTEQGGDSSAQSLIQQELNFSDTAVSKGMKEAFLTFLDDESIIFRPLAINGKKSWSARPAPKGILSWHPTVVELSRSGDFGYTTGPWEFRKEKLSDEPVAYGHFFSVWKHESGTPWKVILDLGNSYHKEDFKKEEVQIIKPGSANRPIILNADSSENQLRITEDLYIHACQNGNQTVGSDKFFADNVRVYRENHFPMSGKLESIDFLKKETCFQYVSVTGAHVSTAGDLGFVYGIAVSTSKDTSNFVRVWRKEQEWKIAIDILSPTK
ncbi:MAG: nuclear transport factor 2 family protein [Bacteroidota bacterium]|nr:nuclear transport factor 2 family protein [Bacteroidota bacterium]